ncbi:MAG: efflux RND transporter periplasmic adaptor subunit [Pseudomonadota bacterium]
MRITSIALALVLVGGLYYWFVARHQMGEQQAAAVTETTQEDASAGALDPVAEAAVPVMVMESRAQPTQSKLLVTGRTRAVRNIHVAAQTTGQVVSQPLRRGARVVEGDVLCRLDEGIRAAELAEAEAALVEAEAESGATDRLSKRGFAAEMTVKTQRAALQRAQAQLDGVRWDIAQLEIRAPFDGVLESDTAELGTLLTPGAICANVIDMSRVKIEGYVAEREVDLLSVGQIAQARLINGVKSAGEITFLSRVADETTRTFAVEVTMDNPGGRIRDGMTAQLQIDLPPQTAHLVPQSALTLDDAGRMGVRVNDGGTARFAPISILNQTDDGGFWVGGLPDAIEIIVVGQEFVTDGRRILPQPADWSLLQ